MYRSRNENVNKYQLPILYLILILLTFSCKQRKNEQLTRIQFENSMIFQDTIYEIELIYIGMACDCPQWATPLNIEKYEQSINSGYPIAMDSLFYDIREYGTYKQNPFDLDSWQRRTRSSNKFNFTGRLSLNKFKRVSEDGILWENKVFEYNHCEFKS